MAEKIDLSLDDIIKRDRITVGRRGRGGARIAGRGASTSVRGRRPAATTVRKIGAVGRQMKSTGGAGPKRVQNLTTKTNTRQVPDKWLHDKFVGEVKSSALMISNLDYGVSDQDIRELFSEFGPLKKTAVHYDSAGRSLGKADVVFVKIADAIRAMKKYNGVPLDGRPMNIQPAVTSTVKTTIASRIGNGEGFKQQGLKPTTTSQRGRARQGAPVRGARRGGRGGRVLQRNPRSGPRKTFTAEELDADLDAYTNKV